MARIRTIKPQFWTDESVVELPYEYRLLFIGLWNFADDEGFIENRPKQIKMQVFPGDPVNVAAGIRALAKRGLIDSVSLDIDSVSVPVLRVKGWANHQVISRPTKSKFSDAYWEYQGYHDTHGGLTEDSRRTPSGRERKGKEGKGREGSQVGGGGHLSSADVSEPPPPISEHGLQEPWRCPKHQGVDVNCYACKDAKAAHKAAEAERAKAAKEAARAAERARNYAAIHGDEATPPDDGTGAAKAKAALKAAKEASA